jgi:predicted metal-binding membrane protein
MSSYEISLQAILKRDRWVVLLGLVVVIALAWAYTIYLAWDMSRVPDMPADMATGMQFAMPDLRPWGLTDFVFIFVMWVVMQIAMMTPSAAPMVLTYAQIDRQQQQQPPYLATGIFFSGYLLMWVLFSAGATVAQWGLHTLALFSPMMVATSPILGGVILIAAGIFQFTPLKHACLAHCRSPLAFFGTEWREGSWGALQMGLRHGGFCVVCCWLLMALLFVAGVMNLLWIVAIATYVLIEKVIPGGHRVAQLFGLLIIGWGVWLIAGSILY